MDSTIVYVSEGNEETETSFLVWTENGLGYYDQTIDEMVNDLLQNHPDFIEYRDYEIVGKEENLNYVDLSWYPENYKGGFVNF